MRAGAGIADSSAVSNRRPLSGLTGGANDGIGSITFSCWGVVLFVAGHLISSSQPSGDGIG